MTVEIFSFFSDLTSIAPKNVLLIDPQSVLMLKTRCLKCTYIWIQEMLAVTGVVHYLVQQPNRHVVLVQSVAKIAHTLFD